MRLASLAIAILTCSVATQAAGRTVHIFGAGAASCGTWLAERRSGNWYSMGNWALGYVAGATTYSSIVDPLDQTDADGVAYWLDNYCQANPADYFREALKAFISAHQK